MTSDRPAPRNARLLLLLLTLLSGWFGASACANTGRSDASELGDSVGQAPHDAAPGTARDADAAEAGPGPAQPDAPDAAPSPSPADASPNSSDSGRAMTDGGRPEADAMAICEPAPAEECLEDASTVCDLLPCGPLERLDEDGCARTTCFEHGECGQGQRCFSPVLRQTCSPVLSVSDAGGVTCTPSEDCSGRIDPYCVEEGTTPSCDGSEMTCEELQARKAAIEGAYEHAFEVKGRFPDDSITYDFRECHSALLAEQRQRTDACGISPCDEFCRLQPCGECETGCAYALEFYGTELIWDALIALSKAGPILHCTGSDCGGGVNGNTCCQILQCLGEEG